MNGNRRSFFKQAGTALAGMVALPAAVDRLATQAQAATGTLPLVAAFRHLLFLNNVFQGPLISTEGGDAFAEVIDEPPDSSNIIGKHLGPVKYSDITVMVGASMNMPFYQWLKDTTDRTPTKQSGSIVAADFRFTSQTQLLFSNALINEIGFPALDASSRDPAMLTVRFTPASTSVSAGTGGVTSVGRASSWLARNFRLTIAGLEAATAHVDSIEAMTIQAPLIPNADGLLFAGPLNIPDLIVTLPESTAGPFYDWHQSFVVQGNNGDDQEKSGSLQFLAPNLSQVLFTLTFSHLGIYAIELVNN